MYTDTWGSGLGPDQKRSADECLHALLRENNGLQGFLLRKFPIGI